MINGIFLIFVGFSVLIESIDRLIAPQEIKTDKLLLVSVLGLLVNLVGLFFFHDFGHQHSDDSPCSHGHHHHKHSHDHTKHHHNHVHSHNNSGEAIKLKKVKSANEAKKKKRKIKEKYKEEHHVNENIYGVFLHILADTLGSVGVIISSICVKYFGYLKADPICSFVIAILIFLSIIPLLKNASQVLTLRVSDSTNKKLNSLINEVIKQN
jgi:solute carrier family 30 (zinc transporter), member 5/7